jgi:glycosyltransferase involved in cell wall biosynthesis
MAVFRSLPRFLDRLWDSRAALKAASKSSIPTSPQWLGELTVSMLKGEDGNQKKEFGKLVDWLKHEAAPDVVSLPHSLLISLAQPIREALKRPITCTLQGEDLFLEGLPEPYRTQSMELIRSRIDHVDSFIAVSDYYAEFMVRYLGIPERKMRVVPLGINLQGYDTGLRFHTNCFTVGYFARVCPEKGLHTLCEAYRHLRQQTEFSGATLEVAGYLAPENKPYLQKVERQMKDWGLGLEFQYRGVLNRAQKVDFLRNLDVLSVPSSYNEPKGIYLLEAMATGVPVVQPRRGAFPEILEKTGGGLLVEAGDHRSIANGILRLWNDRELAAELGRRGAAGVREHYGAGNMAHRTLEVFNSLTTPAMSQRA